MRIKLFMTIAASALLLSACSNDEPELNNEPAELRLSSGVSTLLKSAANTQENTIVSGETVSVWVDDATTSDPLYSANQLTADGNNEFSYATAMYFPQTGNAVDIYALHGNFSPALTTGDAFPTSGTEYSVPANQSTGVTAYTNADLLYAYSKNIARNGNPTTVNLTFYHILSKLELAIAIGDGVPAPAASNAVRFGNNNIVLNGKFTASTSVDMTDQAARAALLTTADIPISGTMGLGQQISTDFTEANVVYNEAIFVPQDVSGKELTFILADGGTLKYAIPASTTFESGKKYKYHITLNLTGLTVTSSITDWQPVSAVSGNAEMD